MHADKDGFHHEGNEGNGKKTLDADERRLGKIRFLFLSAIPVFIVVNN
jgi:hypothetical protein